MCLSDAMLQPLLHKLECCLVMLTAAQADIISDCSHYCTALLHARDVTHVANAARGCEHLLLSDHVRADVEHVTGA